MLSKRLVTSVAVAAIATIGFGSALVIQVTHGAPSAPAGTLADTSVTPFSTAGLLPVAHATDGAESVELRTLREMAPSRGPESACGRSRLFPEEAVVPPPDYARPAGLRVHGIHIPEDRVIDAYLAQVLRDDRTHAAVVHAIAEGASSRIEIDLSLRASHVPHELGALALVESGFVPTETDANGAGIWCLPNEVAHLYGLVVVPGYDERRNTRAASGAVARYLSDLHERFGSWEFAIVAFGTGYRALVGALGDITLGDVWTLTDRIPPQGLDYLREALAAIVVLENRDHFGLDGIHEEVRRPTGDLEVPAGVSFDLLARAASIGTARLRALNPEYTGDFVPNAGIPMMVHVPADTVVHTREILMPLLYAAPGSPLSERGTPRGTNQPTSGAETRERIGGNLGAFYRARDGDTLDSIAARFGRDRETLARDNALAPTTPLRAGQLLVIRGRSTAP